MASQVIFLFGRPGVGKLTVGELLSVETGYRLLHNHAVVDLVTSLFSFGSPPFVALLVSGGHTMLLDVPAWGDYRLLGETQDDAAGEAFDKVGRLLGLGYPGGPAIQRAAEAATTRDRVFPRAWLGDSYDFSFSGLKTAARRIIDAARAEAGLAEQPDAPLPDPLVAELAWGFQEAVVDVLATKTIRAVAT